MPVVHPTRRLYRYEQGKNSVTSFTLGYSACGMLMIQAWCVKMLAVSLWQTTREDQRQPWEPWKRP